MAGIDWNPFSAGFWDPARAFGSIERGAENVGRDAGKIYSDITGLFDSGGKKGPPGPPPGPNVWGEPNKPDISKSSPLDFIQQYMNAAGAPKGLSAQQIYDYLAAKDPKSLKDAGSLQQALNQYSQYAGWSGPGQQQTTSASIIDPIAVQQFYQSTIAPYLNQVASNEKQTANQLRSQPPVQGLPASYAAVVKQGEQTQAQDMDMLQQATQAAAAVGPQVAMLNQMLGLAQKASLQQYYRQLAAGAGGAGQVAAPTGGY